MENNQLTSINGQQDAYLAPEVDVIEVVVEQGFAGSGDDDSQLPGWKPTYW